MQMGKAYFILLLSVSMFLGSSVASGQVVHTFGGSIDVGTPLVNMSVNTTFPAFDPVVWYSFEEGDNGSVAVDRSGNGLNGTNSGTTYVSSKGINGTGNFSEDFDGSDQYVQVGHNISLNISDNITMMAWINPDDSVITARLIYKNQDVNGDQNGFQMTRNSAESINIGIRRDTVHTRKRTTTTVPDNEWTHVAGTISGSTIVIYINGVSQSLTTSNVGYNGASTDLFIGIRADLGSDYNGQLDEPAIFDRVLNASEILEAYNNGLRIEELNTNVTTVSGGPKFLVKEDGGIEVFGAGTNSTFFGDVTIQGTLFGGSPVKLGGGVKISGGLFADEFYSDSVTVDHVVVTGDLHGLELEEGGEFTC